MFLAVMSITPEGRVAKYQDFETEAEALAHVEKHVERWPDAFVTRDPGGNFADWKASGKTLVIDLRPVVAPVIPDALKDGTGAVTRDEMNALKAHFRQR